MLANASLCIHVALYTSGSALTPASLPETPAPASPAGALLNLGICHVTIGYSSRHIRLWRQFDYKTRATKKHFPASARRFVVINFTVQYIFVMSGVLWAAIDGKL